MRPSGGERPLYVGVGFAAAISGNASRVGGFILSWQISESIRRSVRFESARARDGDVQAWAFGLVDSIGREELFRQRKLSGRIAELPPQVGQLLSRRNVVIDNRHK